MRFLTGELYQKKLLFPFFADDELCLEDIKFEYVPEMDEFFQQELLARDEWYLRYLPDTLKEKLFNDAGEVIVQHLDEALLKEIEAFCLKIDKEWCAAKAKAEALRQQVKERNAAGLNEFLALQLVDSEIEQVQGLDTDEVTIKIYPAWDFSKTIWLTFSGVKDSWMGKMHRDDANWWLVDEINVDEERDDRYELRVLFGHADYVGQLQLSFTDVAVQIENN